MTAALEGGEWSAARPGRTLPPGKTRYPFYRSLGWPQGRSGRAENLVPTGIRSRTVQPVVSRYTDWAIRPTGYVILIAFPRQHWLRERASLFNPLNAELNPTCHLLALLGAHHIFHVSWLRVNVYTLIACVVYVYCRFSYSSDRIIWLARTP